ncbi:MAG TPA: hypothetical protein VGG54_22835 [Trebonia sp.]
MKIIVAEARQWDGSLAAATDLIDWILASGGTARYHDEGPSALSIDVPAGIATAVPGDWIIMDDQGQFRPVDARAYERMTAEVPGTP